MIRDANTWVFELRMVDVQSRRHRCGVQYLFLPLKPLIKNKRIA